MATGSSPTPVGACGPRSGSRGQGHWSEVVATTRKATPDTLVWWCIHIRWVNVRMDEPDAVQHRGDRDVGEERYPHNQWNSCKNSLYMAISPRRSTLMIIWLAGSLFFLHSFPPGFFQEWVLETISGIPFSKNLHTFTFFFPASRNSWNNECHICISHWTWEDNLYLLSKITLCSKKSYI